MTVPDQQNQVPEQKTNDKEFNFRQIEVKLQQERNARIDAEKRAEDALKQAEEAKRQFPHDEDDNDTEPYVDHKKLNKKLAKFSESSKQQTQSDIQKAVNVAIQEERKQNWMKSNPDFYDVLQHAEKFAQHDPELAETILQMPEGFDRQKLVYKNIKALGLHKPPETKSSVQSQIDANRKSPYYQPTSVGAAPYGNSGDFSAAGQKNAYAKMQELKSKLKL